MGKPVRFFDSTYESFSDRVQAEVRRGAFGEDIGQNSWLTAEELRRFLGQLGVGPGSHLLEIASGSGGPALYAARTLGCRVTGIEINAQGVARAREMAQAQQLESRARFLQADAGRGLDFPDGEFDAALCIDAINHFPSRAESLTEWHRVLKPGGRLLFTDPVVVTGLVSNEELALRSSIGFFLFAPPGEDDRLLEATGFRLLSREDVTENMALVSRRWHDARAAREPDLVRIEGEDTFRGTQRFFAMVHTLSSERRLSRFAFLAQK